MWIDEGNGFERLHNQFGPTSTTRPTGGSDTLLVHSPLFNFHHRRRVARTRRKLSKLSAFALSALALSLLALAVVFIRSSADDRLAGAAQRRLASELAGQDTPTFVHNSRSLVDLAAVALPDVAASATTRPLSSSVSEPLAARPADSGPIGRIVIPAAGVDAVFVAGVGEENLKEGPGWMPGTAMPGELGNAVVSGHRTTYGGPFRGLGRLNAGDEIAVLIPGRPTLTYQVRAVFSVPPDQIAVTFPTPGARLTLTTCHPEGSSAERLIVQAELVGGPNAAESVPADQWRPQR